MKFWFTYLLLIFIQLLFCKSQNQDIVDSISDAVEFAKLQYPETDQVDPVYDFIIVGAGSAGCVLANRLSEILNWTVLLIEAGGQESLFYDVPALPEYLQQTSVDWKYITEPSYTAGLGLKNQSFAFPRGKVVGGSSVIHSMIYTRGNPEDYNRWENVYKNYGWNFKNLEKYFKKLENYTVVDEQNKNYFGKDGPLYIREVPYHSELSTSILTAARQYGLKLTNTNGPEQIGISRVQTTTRNGLRFSSNRAYLVPIRNKRPNLHLKINCQVTQILISNQVGFKPRAVGVQFSCASTNYTVYARKEVIISAGTINSPQLLMLSGIGHKQHLEQIGIPVVKDLPVGDNLMDHVYTFTVQFLVNKRIFKEDDFKYYFQNRSGPLSIPSFIELVAFMRPYPNNIQSIEQLIISSTLSKRFLQNLRIKEELYKSIFESLVSEQGFTVLSLLQKPKSRGFIRLRDKNPFSHPKIYPNYLTHKDDIQILINGIREAINITQQPALKEWNATLFNYQIPTCAQYEFQSDNYWKCVIRIFTFTLYHLSGTCKMGPKNDRTAVVDPQLRVHDVDRLRVVDASIMPEIIAGHSNGPTTMIAEKAADMIKNAWYELH